MLLWECLLKGLADREGMHLNVGSSIQWTGFQTKGKLKEARPQQHPSLSVSWMRIQFSRLPCTPAGHASVSVLNDTRGPRARINLSSLTLLLVAVFIQTIILPSHLDNSNLIRIKKGVTWLPVVYTYPHFSHEITWSAWILSKGP